MQALFTGFDSSRQAYDSGAICELLWEGESLLLVGHPQMAKPGFAARRVWRPKAADLHVWAIHHPLIVTNETGARPVDSDLYSALDYRFGYVPHFANQHKFKCGLDAPIRRLTKALDNHGYQQNPMAVPAATGGRFYFETDPQAALLGLFDLPAVLKYKLRHKVKADWTTLLNLLLSLNSTPLRVRNIGKLSIRTCCRPLRRWIRSML
jgi:predicted RNase H-like nuclease